MNYNLTPSGVLCSPHGDYKKKLDSGDRAAVIRQEGLDVFTISLRVPYTQLLLLLLFFSSH